LAENLGVKRATDPGNALYQQVSAEGQSIIRDNMPVLTE